MSASLVHLRRLCFGRGRNLSEKDLTEGLEEMSNIFKNASRCDSVTRVITIFARINNFPDERRLCVIYLYSRGGLLEARPGEGYRNGDHHDAVSLWPWDNNGGVCRVRSDKGGL